MGEKKTDNKVELNDSKTAHTQEIKEQDLARQRGPPEVLEVSWSIHTTLSICALALFRPSYLIPPGRRVPT
jgi:hypothetical protein